LQKNALKEKLTSGKATHGRSLSDWLDPELPVLLAAAGLDLFFIDTEHSTTSYEQIKGLPHGVR
jgi:2-keto-3-deoxy-L-rhamnonate aldolase RhmA